MTGGSGGTDSCHPETPRPSAAPQDLRLTQGRQRPAREHHSDRDPGSAGEGVIRPQLHTAPQGLNVLTSRDTTLSFFKGQRCSIYR